MSSQFSQRHQSLFNEFFFLPENGALLQFPQRVNRSSLEEKDEEPSTGRFHPGRSGHRWFWDEGLGSSTQAHMLEHSQGDNTARGTPHPGLPHRRLSE